MKTHIVVCLGLAIGLATSLAAAQESKVCLSGVCMGATLDQIPKNIKWQIDPPFKPRGDIEFYYPAWDTFLPENIQASPSVIKDLKRYRNLYGKIASLNANVIALLQHVRGTCTWFSVERKFKSESGNNTRVTVEAYANQDGSEQQFKVSLLARDYPEIHSIDDSNRLADDMEAKFGVPVSRYMGGATHIPRDLYDDEPKISFSGTSTVIINRSHESQSKIDPYAFARFPGCSKAQKID